MIAPPRGMKQFSIQAMADCPVAIPEPLIMLDQGFNVFQIRTDDIEGILDLLRGESVSVIAINELGQDEAPTLEDELLPGETSESIGVPQEV